MGNRGCSQFITHCLCCSFSSGSPLLLLRERTPYDESFPWAVDLHKLLQHASFPWGAVLHELPQCESFPQGAAPQEQAASAWVPWGVTNPGRKAAPAWASLSTGPHVLSRVCSSAGSPQGHSLLWASPCSNGGSSQSYRWGSAPLWTSMVCSTGCRGTSATWNLCFGAWSTSSLSFCTDLDVCRVVSPTYSHSFLQLQLLYAGHFSPS